MNNLYQKHREEVEDILSRYPEKRAAVMPLLWLAQEEYGYVSEEAMREVAQICELDPTDVYAVAHFYSLYFKEPVGKYVIRFCTDMPCALVGSEQVYQYLLDKLGIQDGETTPDGLFTAQQAVCLAACGAAPVMQINFQYFANLTPQRIDEILDLVRANGLPPNGPLRFEPREESSDA
ncbi:MAG: NADH-quinone oxidoreductase subunit NuoE [Ardenticatenia bacterium]|nr:MAG: NADH-quinone oxidoreductase subunit NuoE [Ardenticatenia bacterium]